MNDVTWSLDDQNTRFRNDIWRQVFDKQLESTPFTIQAANPLFSLPLGESSAETIRWMTREAVWERYHTLSHIAVLEGEELAVSSRIVPSALSGVLTLYKECEEADIRGHEWGRCGRKRKRRGGFACAHGLVLDDCDSRNTIEKWGQASDQLKENL